jgi:hypothetical protein
MRIVKLGVVGSRRRNTPADKELIRKILLHRIAKGDSLHLVSGGCPKGADRFAEELAEELKLSISVHLPDESSLPSNPQYFDYVQMYFARNTLIAQECNILLALPADDRRGGTEDTIRKAQDLGKPVILV